ncbi:hypothetical protein [Agrobacterium sp. T29]|uniref:serine O-acetyltransferase n=1 Tax=Agrobacterium sp. T29 TaxID=2580515 RepID=UPI00352E8A3D
MLSPPLPSNELRTALKTLLDEDSTILAGAGFDMVAVLERDPATAKALHVLLHSKGFLALQVHRFAHTLWKGPGGIRPSFAGLRISRAAGRHPSGRSARHRHLF